MSQRISIANKPGGYGLASNSQSHRPEGYGAASHSQSHKPEGYGAASHSQSHKPEGYGAASHSRSHKLQGQNPKIAENIVWRRDGEADQLIIVSREDLPLPLILNPTAAIIFSLCDGRNSVEKIAERLCQEFGLDDLSRPDGHGAASNRPQGHGAASNRPQGHGAASNSRSHMALEDVKKQIEYFKDKCIVKV